MTCHRTIVQFGLRLIGVWLMAQAFPDLIESVYAAVGRLRNPRPAISDWWYWLIHPTAINLLAIGIGVYLLRGGRALLLLIPPNRDRMCARCDYPLFGLSPKGQCPECGFAYDHRFQTPMKLEE